MSVQCTAEARQCISEARQCTAEARQCIAEARQCTVERSSRQPNDVSPLYLDRLGYVNVSPPVVRLVSARC